MTTTTATGATSSTPSVRAAAGIGTGTAAMAFTLTTLFAHDWTEVIVVGGVIVAVTALVFGLVVPRALRSGASGGTALALAIGAAVVVVPAFWSGLPAVLGVAAMILGRTALLGRGGGGKAIAALVLASLTVLFYLSIYVMEGIAGATGFLLS